MNILFLDIDGPMIPIGQPYKYCDKNKGLLYDPSSLTHIKWLCNDFNMKIVYNTAHNMNGLDHMVNQAKTNNIDLFLHDKVLTDFCNPVNLLSGNEYMYNPDMRKHGIIKFLSENNVDLKLSLDDVKLDLPFHVNIAHDKGITETDYEIACENLRRQIHSEDISWHEHNINTMSG